MASDAKKQQIMEHLAQTSGNMSFASTPAKLTFTPPAPAVRNVQEHLSRTMGQMDLGRASAEARKQQIRDHIRRSRG